MLTTLKVHSAFNKFFDKSTYSVDIHSYADLLFYVNSMHPKFRKYQSDQEAQGEYNEGYVFLDNNLNILSNEALYMTKAKENDVIYLVPAIIGGGGKRGGLFAILAIVAVGIATGGFGFFAGAGAAAGGAGAAGTAAATTGSAGFFGTVASAFKALPVFIKSMITSVALSAITMAFQRAPNMNGQTTEAIRENGIFGPLTNSTTSGTPIALHYGMPRVSGQFLSGYIESTVHGKSDVIKVGDKF